MAKKLYNMEEIMEDLEELGDNSTRGRKKRKRVERRIVKLQSQIQDTKNMCDTL